MKNLKGTLVFAQSGGPTSVINASAYGVFSEAFASDCVTRVYGAVHGIKGVLDERLVDIGLEDSDELKLLVNTPSSALGSARYKLKDASVDDRDYKKILEIFKKYDVRYFLLNGGNDSMDTCNKVSRYLRQSNYDCNVIGVPKTIDNDLYGTDHCPGYGSAAKYIAATCMEIALDSRVYDKGAVTVVEIMGRNAGWLTAASVIASYNGAGPDLIYVPENAFDTGDFINSVVRIFTRDNNCIVAVSEGIRDACGKLINEYANGGAEKDDFNHAQLGGVCAYLAGLVKERLKVKVRPIELSLMQRSAAHLASETDVSEALNAGRLAVRAAINGSTDKMIAFKRAAGKEYGCEYFELPLSEVANVEKKLPSEYVSPDKSFITEKFLDYVNPLILGEARPPFVNGVPRFARLKKIIATP